MGTKFHKKISEIYGSIDIFKFKKFIYKFTFLLTVIGLFVLIFDFGYNQKSDLQRKINAFYFVVLWMGIVTTFFRYWMQRKALKAKVISFDFISILITIYVISIHFFSAEAHRHLTFLYNDNWVKITILLTFIREFSDGSVSPYWFRNKHIPLDQNLHT